MNQPSDALLAGVAILDRVLTPHDFHFEFREAARGSGGDFAWGEYVRKDRRLQLHFRQSLGLVTYHVGDLHMSHSAYLHALGVESGMAQYPGFSDDPADPFHRLASDLTTFLGEFVSGDARVLSQAAPTEMARLQALDRATFAGYEGDNRKREQARVHFYDGEYSRVVELLEDVHYPELLSESERRMLTVARNRAAI